VYKTELLKKKNRMHTFDTFFCCRKKQDHTKDETQKKGIKNKKHHKDCTSSLGEKKQKQILLTAGRSTMDAIFLIRQLMERCRSKRKIYI
jgi:phosphoheptose isomerase